MKQIPAQLDGQPVTLIKYEMNREVIESTASPTKAPDPEWVYADSAGHIHPSGS